jgi:molecular chaperone GrpE
MTPKKSSADKKENPETESEATDQAPDPAAEPDAEAAPEPEDAENTDGEPEAPDEPDEPDEPDVESLQAEVADLSDKLLRALAETENIRRRAERDKGDASKYAITNFAREMLSVSDTLQRALGSVDAAVRKEHAVIEQLMVGLEMNEREIKTSFERFGIKDIEAMGEKFDHNLHEAMFEIDDPSKPVGTVVQVMETGYVLKDRLLRPAKVGVSKGGPAPAKDSSMEDTPAPTSEDESEQKDGQTAYEDKGGEPGAQLDEEL